MSETVREQMLASTADAVNALCSFAQDQQLADFNAREERVLEVGRRFMTTWLGQLAGAADRGLRHARSAAFIRSMQYDVGANRAH